MIKNNNSFREAPLFHPTFGSRPARIVGRESVLEQFLQGMDAPIGSRDRCILLTGQTGMGKTSLLLEMRDMAPAHDMIPALVTVHEKMNEEIIETVQRNGERYVSAQKRQLQGFEIGALGFSAGLTFNDTTENHYGFRTKLTLLCDELGSNGKGILILVDEVTNSEEMRQLGITYQNLVGENKNIMIVMAGLPQSVSSVLNDRVLTFLNRAKKISLGPLSIVEIRAYYYTAFSRENIAVTPELLDRAAEATYGFPYLMQLIGYYLMYYAVDTRVISEETVNEAIRSSEVDLAESVFAPILYPLSDGDRRFLCAMAEDDGKSSMAEIGERLGKDNSYLQAYRARLVGAGIIESPQRGYVQFTVPYLAEYLRKSEM